MDHGSACWRLTEAGRLDLLADDGRCRRFVVDDHDHRQRLPGDEQPAAAVGQVEHHQRIGERLAARATPPAGETVENLGGAFLDAPLSVADSDEGHELHRTPNV